MRNCCDHLGLSSSRSRVSGVTGACGRETQPHGPPAHASKQRANGPGDWRVEVRVQVSRGLSAHGTGSMGSCTPLVVRTDRVVPFSHTVRFRTQRGTGEPRPTHVHVPWADRRRRSHDRSSPREAPTIVIRPFLAKAGCPCGTAAITSDYRRRVVEAPA